MKFVWIFVFLFKITFCFSQSNWAEIGTKWWYERPFWGPPTSTAYHTLEVVKDTVINNKTVKKLDWKTFYEAGVPNQQSSLFTFEDSGKIYFIFENDSFEYKIYDFSAEVGDTVTIFPKWFSGGVDSFQVTIDSIRAVNFNGIYKDVIYNSSIYPSNYHFGNWIYNIGSDRYFLPQYGAADPPDFGTIRCYENASTGLINFSNAACDTVSVGIELPQNSNYKINVYPNPAGSYTTIEWKLPFHNAILTIKDISGKEIVNIPIKAKEGKWLWDTRKTSNGMYFYEIRTSTEKLASGNIAVQH